MNDRIKDLGNRLQEVFEGEAWHGPSFVSALESVDSSIAFMRHAGQTHTIAEIVMHAAAWKRIVRQRLEGDQVLDVPREVDWPPVEANVRGWEKVTRTLREEHNRLQESLKLTDASRLLEKPVGIDHECGWMLSGLVDHDLYHLGQIVLLKRIMGVD
jgi:uncharacterized damage-inducible protein DinB